MNQLMFLSSSPEETETIGGRLAGLLSPGDVITLTGELGSGKTCFVRGLVTALSPEQGSMVSSPTYAIMNEYSGTISVYHLDCYRLRGADDATELGFEELFSGRGISLIEWPERVSGIIPDTHLNISFEHLDVSSRQIRLQPSGSHFIKLLEMFACNLQKNLV